MTEFAGTRRGTDSMATEQYPPAEQKRRRTAEANVSKNVCSFVLTKNKLNCQKCRWKI